MIHLPVIRAFLAIAVLLSGGLVAPLAQAAGATVRIGGSGAAIGQMTLLAEGFAELRPDIAVEVLPSLGSSGGIRALIEGAIDIAVSARPLKPDEAAHPLEAVPLSRSPIVLVSSLSQPPSIAADDLAGLYADPNARWPDGTPLRIILRPVSDADSAYLRQNFNGMAVALEQAQLRPEVPVASTDQENIALASRIDGSLTISSLTQILSEEAAVTIVPFEGAAATLDNLENGSYPFFKEFTMVRRDDSSAAVDSFVAFIGSSRGRQILRDSANLPLL